MAVIEKTKHIKLIMNVRDDAEKLANSNCLESAAKVCSSWYIKDTGSTDNTKEYITKFFETVDIPGEFGPDEEWVGHAHNRTLLLEEAVSANSKRAGDGRASYFLMMDSDMELDAPDDTDLSVLEDDMYFIDLHDRHMVYPLPLLTKSTKKFIYQGPAHAYLVATFKPVKSKRLRGWKLIDHGNGKPREGKIENDLKLFRQAVAENPNDHRSWFYLAQSYRDLEMWEEAVQAYKFRASLGGWDEEVYSSLLNAGVIMTRKFSVTEGLSMILEAWKYRPGRAEPLRALSAAASVVADQIPFPKDDLLFIDRNAYRPTAQSAALLNHPPVLPLLPEGSQSTENGNTQLRRKLQGENGKPNYSDISAILVTRGNVDMAPIVDSLPYEDIVIWDNSDESLPDYKIFGRYAAIRLAKNPIIYWQDDDVIFTAHDELLAEYEPGKIISNMDKDWIDGAQYGDFLGMVGAGSLCDIDLPDKIFAEYLKHYPFDEDLLYECDFMFGVLAPFKRVDLGYRVREFADDDTRLYRQPWQQERKWQMINRCRQMLPLMPWAATPSEIQA